MRFVLGLALAGITAAPIGVAYLATKDAALWGVVALLAANAVVQVWTAWRLGIFAPRPSAGDLFMRQGAPLGVKPRR